MIDKNSIHTILIPDVHGRKFWENAMPYIEDGVPAIFMGDYLDVYSHENISRNSAVENFEKILDVAKNNKNVQLLFGNHDAGYALDRSICDCRTDNRNSRKIKTLFKDNFCLFKLCKTVKADDEKTFMISHAGFHPYWLSSYKDTFLKMSAALGMNFEHIEDFINNVLLAPFKPGFWPDESDDTLFAYKAAIMALGACGRERGGIDSAGSLIWADIHEFEGMHEVFKYEQIVGHTMQYYTVSPAIIPGVITCIDCFDNFFIDKEGDLRRLSDGILAEQVWDANKEERERRCKGLV